MPEFIIRITEEDIHDLAEQIGLSLTDDQVRRVIEWLVHYYNQEDWGINVAIKTVIRECVGG